jgi:hypothetical protein
MNHVNGIVHLHDSSIDIEYLREEDNGLHMQVIILNLDKFLGLNEIAKIINRALKKFNLELITLSLKR